MPIEYTLSSKKNLQNPDAPAKYYANAKSHGEATIRNLSEQIAEISTVSTIDIMAVIEGFLKEVPKFLADGKIVRLGDFGSFYVTVQSEGTENAEDFSSNHIKGSKIHFRPGKLVKDVLENVKYKKID